MSDDSARRPSQETSERVHEIRHGAETSCGQAEPRDQTGRRHQEDRPAVESDEPRTEEALSGGHAAGHAEVQAGPPEVPVPADPRTAPAAGRGEEAEDVQEESHPKEEGADQLGKAQTASLRLQHLHVGALRGGQREHHPGKNEVSVGRLEEPAQSAETGLHTARRRRQSPLQERDEVVGRPHAGDRTRRPPAGTDAVFAEKTCRQDSSGQEENQDHHGQSGQEDASSTKVESSRRRGERQLCKNCPKRVRQESVKPLRILTGFPAVLLLFFLLFCCRLYPSCRTQLRSQHPQSSQ